LATWEDTKRAAQSTYNTIGSVYQNAYEGLGNTYQQILTTGRIYPDASSLTNDIATGAYDPTPEDWQEYGQYVDQYSAQNPAPEQGELFYLNQFPDKADTGLEPEI
jgi:hypothetical protein